MLSEIILDEDAVTADLGSLRLERDAKLRTTSDAKALEEAFNLKRQEILDASYLIEDYVEQQFDLKRGKYV